MSHKPLTAVVIGAGWAGEGHTLALQHAGVEVAAICARNADATQSVATRLGVRHASTDWRASLRDLKPDIVTLATPTVQRIEMVEQATQLGCHILCEKPLAATVEDAHRLLTLVKQAGVKHAYAASQRYDPGIAWAAELIAGGQIGALRAIELVFCGPFSSDLLPWIWMDMVAQGGGNMNAILTHFLAMLERVAAGKVIAVAGEARVIRHRAPVLTENLRNHWRYGGVPLTAEQAAVLEWRARDGDDAFFAILQIVPQSSPQSDPVVVMLNYNEFAAVTVPYNGWYFRGSEADLIGEGYVSLSISRWRGEEKEVLPTPQRLIDALPQIGDDATNKWAALMRDFVADICGETHDPYLNFHDGWRYQAVIDAIRHGRGWYRVPESPGG